MFEWRLVYLVLMKEKMIKRMLGFDPAKISIKIELISPKLNVQYESILHALCG